jgi:hypothetical protein
VLKINYPQDKSLRTLESAYIKTLGLNVADAKRIDALLNSKKLSKFGLSLGKLLVLPFDHLLNLAFNLSLTPNQEIIVSQILNYTKYQPRIAQFFMERGALLDLSTCFFCNIDFINPFPDLPDFHTPLDFVKNADEEDLVKIKAISSTIAKAIVKQQKNISSIDELKISNTCKNNLRQMVTRNIYNHFTLDHLIPKKEHPLFALCLYNFIPSCYSCNAKFKKAKPLFLDQSHSFLSATSKKFDIHKNVRFEILFRNAKDINQVSKPEDFILNIGYGKNEEHYSRFMRILKLQGRYVFHKIEAIRLIKKKARYSRSQIDDIAKVLNLPFDVVNQDIFGEELFNLDLSNKPLTKLKKDIAKNIGIDNVI